MVKSRICFWTQPVAIGGQAYELTVASTSQGLCRLSLDLEGEEALPAWAERWLPGQELLREKEANALILAETAAYLAQERRQFTVPLHLLGTPFQIRVWQELRRIPYGETRSYADIAAQIGCPQGWRAVGSANSRNPLALIVPCHRVIGKDGRPGGYRGGLDLKLKLLRLEDAQI